MRILLLLFLFYAQTAVAALPPKYRHEADLDTMVNFIKGHDHILETLKSIDFAHYTVFFDNDCKAIFARKKVDHPQGWVGPAAPLEFRSSNCDI